MGELFKEFFILGDSKSLFDILNLLELKEERRCKIHDCIANYKLTEKLVNQEYININFSFEQEFSSDKEWKEVKFLPSERLLSNDEKEKALESFNQVLISGHFTSGLFVEQFEKSLTYFLSKEYVIGTSSGTDAIVIALKSVGVGYGDEVIIPANSFAATENAVLACGAIPVLIDISINNYNLDVTLIEKHITNRTKAILPVHLYGKLADMKTIRKIADNYQLTIVEDACQAIGVTGVGEYSDVTALSFNPYKNFGLCGKAGAIVTNNENIATTSRALSYHGFAQGKKNIKVEVYGYNARIDNTQAAIGMSRLPFMSFNNFKRLYLAKRYIKYLFRLVEQEKIIIPEYSDDNSWHLFPIQILNNQSRDEIRKTLKQKENVQTDIYYPVLTHKQNTSLQKSHFSKYSLPNTELVHSRLIHLPLHNQMTLQEQDKVIQGLYNVIK
jgi:3-dehydro-glucose-6-phosphate--glutamate transaminase